MKIRTVLCVGVLTYALWSGTACRRNNSAEPPVAAPSLSLNKPKAAIGSPIEITYKFEVAPEAKFDADYLVFVHVIEPDGEKLWQDDHSPAVPTSRWQPGQTIEYTRTVFVPNYPYLGDANIRMGLYNPATGKRLPLSGQEVARREYLVGKLNVLPPSENIFLIYKEGWHLQESDPNDPASEWQWTKQVATISFRNPKRDAVLFLDSDARSDLFNPPQQVTIKVDGKTIGSFAADSRERQLRKFPITAEQFGTGDMAELVIDADRTFSPGGGDTRELGIRVYHAFVQPN